MAKPYTQKSELFPIERPQDFLLCDTGHTEHMGTFQTSATYDEINSLQFPGQK